MEATLRLAQSCLSDAHLMYKKLGSKKVKLVLLSSSLKIRRMESEVSKTADRIADPTLFPAMAGTSHKVHRHRL